MTKANHGDQGIPLGMTAEKPPPPLPPPPPPQQQEQELEQEEGEAKDQRRVEMPADTKDCRRSRGLGSEIDRPVQRSVY